MQCVWETESTKTQIHGGQGRKKGVLDGEKVGDPWGVRPGALQLWTEDLCGRGLWVLLLGMGGLVPLSLLSPSPSPRPLRRRTSIIESTFQYLFTLLLLLWVAITVYIICLSVLPGRCSLLAERFEEWEGGEKGQALTLCCHLKWWPGCLGMRESGQALRSHSPGSKCH